jgi:hypothetical protein
MTRDAANATRFDPKKRKGHYESWFLRANHPSRPFGFWIRYTIFAPAKSPDTAAVGELWGIWFDGEKGRHTAVKSTVPRASCSFSASKLDVRIGSATLVDGTAQGAASTGDRSLSWDLGLQSSSAPLFLLPERLYEAPFPKAKALVPQPLACFRGTVTVGADAHDVGGWVGSQNHNWGERHTDRYAWGQVSGFDGVPDAFLECATARIKVGPVLSPPLTTAVLVLGDERFVFTALRQTVAAQATLGPGRWELETSNADATLLCTFRAAKKDFVGLRYPNPPGGIKTCLNSKIAACDLVLRRYSHPSVRLSSESRAAFEILTDEADHGVEMLL